MGKELADAFRELKKRGVDTFAVTVVSVDKTQGTCVVNDGEIDYTDVQLSAIIDGSNQKFLLFPKVESSVLVSPIMEDLHRLYVEAYSEIEEFQLIINNCQLIINKDGFLLKKENETLKKLMADFIDAVKNISFVVTTPSGPGATTTLNNLAEFEGIETRFNQFLKDN